MTDILHYGTLRKSGRYPWGSGGELLGVISSLQSEGLTEKEIAKSLDMSTTRLRNQKTLSKLMEKEAKRIFVTRQRDGGMSVEAIHKESNIAKATIRDLLKPAAAVKYQIINTTAKVLRKAIDRFVYIDIGEGVEQFMGITGTKLKNAIGMLEMEGYKIHYLREEQMGTGKKTTIKVMTAEGVPFKDVYANRASIAIPNSFSDNNGLDFKTMSAADITNISSDRLQIIGAEQGGGDRDGLIELRRDTHDLSLGAKNYAQVRIAIDDSHYIKGVAVYADDLPPGVDIRFNSSKTLTDNKLDALKPQKQESDNPFGTSFRPGKPYLDGGKTTPSGLNIVYEEGDWSNWSNNLSSQFLSKQAPKLAADQLALTYDRQLAEYETIMSLTNPVVKKHLLNALANSADSSSIFLKAAAMPRQTTSVLLPEPTMKSNEVFAPQYKNGDTVVLIRHPHGGKFEIPTLTVNNKNKNALRVIGSSAQDAVAIHPSVAQRLSGADYDGDSVLVIPNKNQRIRTEPALESLKNFDPKQTYPMVSGMKIMTERGTQLHMGNASNLITDMTIKGASQDEIARAVRYSMVVIDAEKHGLNYAQASRDNGISALKTKYQGSGRAGAATIISRAKSQQRVLHRRDNYDIDPKTGKKVFTHTDKTYVNKKGETVSKMSMSKKMYEIDDARLLSSGTVIEDIYAKHANKLKALGDRARLSLVSTPNVPYSKAAYRTYRKEVDDLNASLRLALRHQPLERKAQLLAGHILRTKKENNPGMSKKEIQTAKGRALVTARTRIGPSKPTIDISPRQWEAIQMGAVSSTKLTRILRNADMDQVKQYATPQATRGLPNAKILRAKVLLDAGYTSAEVASAIGASQSQILGIEKS